MLSDLILCYQDKTKHYTQSDRITQNDTQAQKQMDKWSLVFNFFNKNGKDVKARCKYIWREFNLKSGCFYTEKLFQTGEVGMTCEEKAAA